MTQDRDRRTRGRDILIVVAIFLMALALFLSSPVNQVGDSRYTLLLTQNLLSKGSFVLDGYSIPREPEVRMGKAVLNGSTYQLEIVDGHYYYYFPPGSSILSAPFVVAADYLHYPLVQKHGTHYNARREEKLQHRLASLLMAGLAVTFYFTGRCLLNPGWSACIALGGVLGTQIWSTASCALWGHTWGAALLGHALWLMLAHETGQRRLPPVWLASVLSWSYFVRPTNSLFIAGLTVYLLWFHRRLFFPYAATGAAWFAAFAGYSCFHFGTLLPSYYSAGRLELTTCGEALLGNLVSPSRGVLLYVPAALFVGFLVVRYRRQWAFPRLVWLAAGVCAAQLAVVSCFTPWFGGGCYGPRYTTECVPALVLLGVIGVHAASRGGGLSWVARSVGGGLLLLSILIQAAGARDAMTWGWNTHPVSVDAKPSRVWDWRYPQMLAGLINVPLPATLPPLQNGRITFGTEGDTPYLLEGWSGGETGFVWSELPRAAVVFTTGDLSATQMRMVFRPHLHPPRLPRQRLSLFLNDRKVADLEVKTPGAREYTFPVPPGTLRQRNVLRFKLPDAAPPSRYEKSKDDRLLGIALEWIAFDHGP